MYLLILIFTAFELFVFGANIILKMPPIPSQGGRAVPNVQQKNARDLSVKSTNFQNVYVVKPGDTVIGIARRYGVDYEAILYANNLNKDSNIYVGARLKIPSEGSFVSKQSFSSRAVSHTVKSGETLFGIARDYGISVSEIIDYNGFGIDYRVKVGEKVRVASNGKTVGKNKDRRPKTVRSKAKNSKIDCKLNFGWPLYSTKIMYGYGDRLPNGAKLDGVIIQGEMRKSIVASQSGVVAYAGNDVPEYGNLMIIKHKNNWMTIYGNVDAFKKTVGSKVSRGDLIATVGKSGSMNQPSLYFSIRHVKTPYNPELCI